MRTALMPDSEEIEPTGTESSKAKLSERGANSRQRNSVRLCRIAKTETNVSVCGVSDRCKQYEFQDKILIFPQAQKMLQKFTKYVYA